MKAVVAKRGQVTIPKRLGIRPGTVLECREETDKLIAEKTETAGALDRWYGSLGRRRTDGRHPPGPAGRAVITAVDSSIIIDVFEPDPKHGPGSREALRRCLREGSVVACDTV